MKPVFSIIVVSKNEGIGLRNTIDSILKQDFLSYEIVLIDSCSTDGSTNFLNEINISNILFISEKDRGIYDGMNKGIKYSSGNYIYFLNAGDTFHDEKVLMNAYIFLNSEPSLIIGNTLLIGPETKAVESHPFRKHLIFYPGFNHQRIFHHKRLFEEFGLYNLEFKVAADREFLFKVFNSVKDDIKYLDITLAKFFLGGLSSSPKTQKLAIHEQLLLFKKYFNRLERLSFILFFNFDPDWPNPKSFYVKLLNLSFIKSLRFSFQKPISKLLGWV